MQRLVLPPKVWRLSGARPLNHPQRRLARSGHRSSRVAGISSDAVRSEKRLSSQRDFSSGSSIHFGIFITRLSRTQRAERDGADRRIARRRHSGQRLFHSCSRKMPRLDARKFAKRPARLSNRRLETAATRLFGDDPRRAAFLKTVAQQQGLLQIYEDFCLQDNSDCAQCPFPEQMHKWA